MYVRSRESIFTFFFRDKRVYIRVCMQSSFDACLNCNRVIVGGEELGISLEIFEEREYYQSRENEIRGNLWKMGLRNFLSRVFPSLRTCSR